METMGHVVKEWKIGNTTVRICDDYCRDKTPEEVDAILRRIADICYEPLIRAKCPCWRVLPDGTRVDHVWPEEGGTS